MGRIGNIGAIEEEAGPVTRIAIDRIRLWLEELARTSALTVRNATNVTIINNTTPPGAASLPQIIAVSRPEVVAASAEFWASGLLFNFGVPWKITWAHMYADENTPATADTVFTWKNALSGATSSAPFTISSGSYQAQGAITVLMNATQRLYILAPSALHDLQNFKVILFRAERQ